MDRIIEKISLAVIFASTAITLAIPLMVNNSFFFPFISTKVFLFRPIVEIMLLAYLGLNVVSSAYRPRINFITILAFAFLLVATVSSLLGGSFVSSFWGDMERGEGLVLWLHLFVFLFILISTIREEKLWMGFLDGSIGVALLLALFGLGQFLKAPFLLATSGARVDGTLGNAAFFAAYLLFHIAFALHLFFYRSSKPAKFYYAGAAIFFAWVVAATQTRGAMVGLVLGVLFSLGLYVFSTTDRKRAYRFTIPVIAAIVIFAGALYIGRNSSLVKNSSLLNRIASISTTDRTAETRLATWEAGWSGWKEKFWFGWGPENFEVVFNKYFPPIIYEDEGSQVWFDRAHNVIFDRGVTTGIVGLTIFLSLLILPVYYLIKNYLRDPKRRNSAIVFAGFMTAYIIQDLFIFESITSYIILFFTLALFAVLYLRDYRLPNILSSRLLWGALLAIYAVTLGPILWKVNFYPAKINLAAAAALRSNPQEEDFFVIAERFKKIIEADTYAKPEYRIQFVEFINQQIGNRGEVVPAVHTVLVYTDEQIAKQIAEDPDDAKNYLLAMRHYNYTREAYAGKAEERLEKALSFYPKLKELSPTRPPVDQEAGFSHLYLYRLAKGKNDQASSLDHLGKAERYFRSSIDLNPKVVESYINMIMLYLNANMTDEIREIISEMEAKNVNYLTQKYLSRLYNLAKANKNFTWIAFFSEKLVELNPDHVDVWIDLALSYAYLGDRENALRVAERIKQFGGDYILQAEKFIENLNKGFYKAPPP